MKDVIVDAKVPEKKDSEGRVIQKAMIASASVKYAKNIKEAIEMFGEEAILTNAFANWRVTLQSNIRGALKKGETVKDIAARLATAKMGVASTGGKVDPIQAYLASFESATSEGQKKMLADLKARAAKA